MPPKNILYHPLNFTQDQQSSAQPFRAQLQKCGTSQRCVCRPTPGRALAPTPFKFKYSEFCHGLGDKSASFLFCGTGGNLFHFTFKHCCMSKIWKKYDFLPKSFVSATTPTILSFHSPYIDFQNSGLRQIRITWNFIALRFTIIEMLHLQQTKLLLHQYNHLSLLIQSLIQSYYPNSKIELDNSQSQNCVLPVTLPEHKRQRQQLFQNKKTIQVF